MAPDRRFNHHSLAPFPARLKMTVTRTTTGGDGDAS
jgi:hypothetical protein